MEVLKQNLEGHLHTYKYIQTEVEALLKHVLNQGMSYFKGCWTRKQQNIPTSPFTEKKSGRM